MKLQNANHKLWLLCILVAIGIAFHIPQVWAGWLTNHAMIYLVKIPRCDPNWYVCAAQPRYYPPQVWNQNAEAIDWITGQLEQAVRLDPLATGAREHLIELYYAKGDNNTASLLLERSLADSSIRHANLQDQSPIIHLLRSRVLERANDFSGAISEAQLGLKLADFRLPSDRESREVQRISDLFTTLIADNEKVPDANLMYNAILYAACANDWTTAWNRAHQAMEINLSSEQQPVIARLLAWQAHLSGDTRAETQWLAHAGNLIADEWAIGDPYLWLGNYILNFDTHACDMGARAVYTSYASEHPESVQGLYLNGRVDLIRRDYHSAEQAFASVYVRAPTHVGAIGWLGYAFEGEGDYQTAAQWYEKASALSPASSEYQFRLFLVYQVLGRTDEARISLNKAIAQGTRVQSYLLLAGYFFEKDQQFSRAREMFEAVLEINPANIDAKRALDKLDHLENGQK